MGFGRCCVGREIFRVAALAALAERVNAIAKNFYNSDQDAGLMKDQLKITRSHAIISNDFLIPTQKFRFDKI